MRFPTAAALLAFTATACGPHSAAELAPGDGGSDAGVVLGTADAGNTVSDAGPEPAAGPNLWPEPGPSVRALSAPGAAQALYSFVLPAAPADIYSIEGRARRVSFSTPGASGGLQVAFLDSAGAVLAVSGGLGVTSSSWVTPFTRASAPAGTASVRCSLAASQGADMEFSDVVVQHEARR